MMAVTPGGQFASDTAAGVHPAAWEALSRAVAGFTPGYGTDDWTARATTAIRKLLQLPEAAVFFVSTGTAANALAIAHLCAPYDAVVCHAVAHIAMDECSAPAFFGHGTALIPVPGDAGKLTPESARTAATRRTDVHHPRAKLLSVTQSTEVGTVYSVDELAALGDEAKRLGLRVHLDGARLANACASLRTSPAEIVRASGADVVCVGGTKNGMTATEAVVFPDPTLADGFLRRCKQAGHLPPKARFLAAPWVGMLESGAWLEAASHANAMAATLAVGLKRIPGVTLHREPEANGVFAKLPAGIAVGLRARGWIFYALVGEDRLMCSWATTPADVEALLADARAAAH